MLLIYGADPNEISERDEIRATLIYRRTELEKAGKLLNSQKDGSGGGLTPENRQKAAEEKAEEANPSSVVTNSTAEQTKGKSIPERMG